MITQSLKISLRRLIKFKAYSLINIVGLGMAIAACVVILLYAYHHYSFDRYVKDAENCYRLISRYGDGTFNANTFAAFGDLLSESPEVKDITVCYTQHHIDHIFVDDKKMISVNEAIFINSSFNNIFPLKIREGTIKSIDRPNTMLVTPEMAQKLYPDEQAIGKTVMIKSFTADRESFINFVITGIVEPLPGTSHIGFDILLSQEGHFTPTVNTVKERKVFAATIYLHLFPSTDVEHLESRLVELSEVALAGKHGPSLEAFNHRLQPLLDIHFTPDTILELRPTIRRSSLNILLLIGILILTIASVNFLNMQIAVNGFLQKESSIMRFLGASGKNLSAIVAAEILISVLASFVFAILLVVVFRNVISDALLNNWQINLYTDQFWQVVLILFLVTFIVNALIRIIINTLKSNNKLFRKKDTMVPSVVFQFVLVIALLGFTILINKQMNFIAEKSLGYSADNVIVIPTIQQNEKVKLLRDELAKESYIQSTSMVRHYPGFRLQDMIFSDQDNEFPFKFGHIDKYTTRTLGIEPVKYFTELRENASNGWLINERFYNELKVHYSDEQIAMSNFTHSENQSGDNSLQDFVILGVIRDFNYASLHNPIENFAFFVRPEDSNNRFVLASFNQNQVSEATNTIKEKFAEILPEETLNYSFLNEELNNKYKSEQTLMKLINMFSVLVFLIACFGLIGLSVFTTQCRTKEIGIRKVNGASTPKVLLMLNKEFVKCIAIGFVIATPVSYYAINKWLQNFAYKTELSWWIFAMAGLITLSVALLTVSWQSWRAARRNPVEALRDE